MTAEALRRALMSEEFTEARVALTLDPKLIEAEDARGVPLYFGLARDAGLATLRFLVEYGLRVNLNAVDARGRDLLHYAAESGDVAKCRYLVERGGMDPLRGDRELTTPFDIAHAQGHGALERYFEDVCGAPLAGMYRNPIRRGMWPDPSVVRVGEDYYMVNSSFVYFPCIPISHSRDLVHWRVIGHAIARPEWAGLEGFPGGYGYWAPDISYANGRFYICATLRLPDEPDRPVRRRQMVVSSENAAGPYTQPAFIDEDGIDPSLFHDDDGRHYMLLNRGARLFELDETCTRRIGEPALLYYGSQKRAPEGPHLIKKDGWYYLFQAEGGTGMGHRETVARARTLTGVYEPSPYNPVIRQTDERAAIQRCGHAKPVRLPDGRWCFVYLCGRPMEGKWTLLGRETALDPFSWTPDGWPLLNGGRGVSALNRMPLPPQPFADDADAFAEYMTPRPPKTGEIAWDARGVTLQGGAFPLSDTRCRSLTVRRQTDFRFRFRAEWVVPEQEGETDQTREAGVVCYYDERSFLTLGAIRAADGWRVAVRERAGEEEREAACWPLEVKPGAGVSLETEADGLARILRWSSGDAHGETRLENVTYLADEGVTGGKRFTGATVGVYARGMEARFEQVQYEPLD